MGVLTESAIYTAVTVINLLRIGVGAVLVGFATVGYRRNQSPAMLALAVGIALLTVLPVVLVIVVERLTSVALASLVSSTAELAGLLVIFYSIMLARRA